MKRRLATVTGVLGAVATAGVAARRYGYRFLLRDPHTPPERYGFHLCEASSRERVARIIEAFFTGYNAAVAGETPESIRARCEALPAVLHPFAFEGSGMGFGARGLVSTRARAEAFERHIEAVHPGYRFMYHVGLGIWSGMLGGWQARAAAGRVVDARYAGLVYDGFGFKAGFFHRARNAGAHRRLDAVPAEERAQAYRGYGRSLWFVFRDDPPGLEEAIAALPEEGREAAIVGVGLAVLFTGPDDLVAVRSRLDAFPPGWQRNLQRGARLALFVRDAGQPQALDSWISALPNNLARSAREDLDHARQACRDTINRPSFLRDFTEAC